MNLKLYSVQIFTLHLCFDREAFENPAFMKKIMNKRTLKSYGII